MILIDSHAHTDLNQLAADHYLALISPQNKNGSYHASQSLIGRIQRQLLKDLLFPFRVRFWEYFINSHYRNLERVISGRPDELAAVIEEIENLIGHYILSDNISYNQATLTSFGHIVKNIFGYENYRDNGRARANVDQFNLNYCPYCNIQKLERIKTTNNLTGLDRDIALYQLDHFYPRSRYPYLAVSFFNLIPGCSNCNVHLKGEKDFNVDTHINSFQKSFDEFFCFRLRNVVFNKPTEVDIDIENVQYYTRNLVDDFKLIERYNDPNTKNKLYDFLGVFRNRSPVFQRSLKEQIKGLFSDRVILNNKLLKSQGVPIYQSQISDYEMGKMKRDICLQLKLI